MRKVFHTLFRKHLSPNLYKDFSAVAKIERILHTYSIDSVSRSSIQTQPQNSESPQRRSKLCQHRKATAELVGLAVSPGTRIASGNAGFGVHVIAGAVVSSPGTESVLL